MSVNIKLPIDQVEAVRQFLSTLSVKKTQIPIIEKQRYEVRNVVDHRFTKDGTMEFKIFFKGDKTSQWIGDIDCDCERFISAYCHKMKIEIFYCFCRVSTKGQVGVDHVSLDVQEREIVEFVNSYRKPDIQVRVKVIKISASAYKDIPKPLVLIGELMCIGDTVVVYRIDRLTRNIFKCVEWLEKLNNVGVSIYSCAEKMFYRENRIEFVQGVLNATKESALLSERIKASIKHRRERGDEHIGRLVYGKMYKRIVTSDKRCKQTVVNDPIALGIMYKIRKLYRNGNTVENIELQLKTEGIKKCGRFWSKKMISNFLSFYNYVGSQGTDSEKSSIVKKRKIEHVDESEEEIDE